MCQVPDQDDSPVTSVDSNTEDWTSRVPRVPIPIHINVQHPIDGTQVSSNYCNLYIGL